MSRLLELDLAANVEIYLEQILAIEQEAFAEPWTWADYINEVSTPIAHLLALVDDAQPERLLAYASFWQVLDEADVNNVAVLASCRGQGLGTLLMAGLLDWARLLGCRRAILEVRPSNAAALALYGKMGFVPCGRRPGYYGDNGEDALLMECLLTESTYENKPTEE